MNKRENIYSLDGFGKVFRFTVRQTFKNKGYLVSFIIFILTMTLMGPIQYIGQRAGTDAAEDSLDFNPSRVEINDIYIFNETASVLRTEDFEALYKIKDDEDIDESEKNKGITQDKIQISNIFDSVQIDKDDTLEKLTDKDIAIVISREETEYTVKGISSDDTEIEIKDLDEITGIVKDIFEQKRLENSDVEAEDAQMIFAGVDTSGVKTESEYFNDSSKSVGRQRYMFYMLGFSIIIFIVISMSTSYIITSVTEEKQSKLVESLLVSVRPMALLLGKVCGMMSYVVLLLICGVIGSNISNFVMKNIFKISEEEFSNQGFNFSIFKDFGVIGAFFLLLSIILAFIAFGMLSGLFGSTCNKTEDIQNATGNIMTISMLSYFATIAVGAIDKNIIGAVVPPFSFYVAPVAYVTGRIGIPLLLLSYLIQIGVVAGIVVLAAKSYRNLLLSDSSTPKLKTIFKSAKR